jgi:hypothetical protein
MKQLFHSARELSPYLLIEVLLPGGTLIALVLWLFNRRKRDVERNPAARDGAGPGRGERARLCTAGCA